jgi:hypothetical protein
MLLGGGGFGGRSRGAAREAGTSEIMDLGGQEYLRATQHVDSAQLRARSGADKKGGR